MKQITILILILSFFVKVQKVNNVTITYTIKQKTIDLTKIKEKAKTSATAQELIWLYEDANDVEATLKFTKNESIYNVIKKLKNDAEKKVNLTYHYAGSKNTYYSDKKELIRTSSVTGEMLRIVERKNEWVLTKETKKIGQFKCYKAIRKNSKSSYNVIAWYAPELPFPFGPREFNGLPGIILELEFKNYIFFANKVDLNDLEFVPIEKPSEGEKITYEDWKKRTKNFFYD